MKPITLIWHKEGVTRRKWSLRLDDAEIASCFYLPGAKRYRCLVSVPAKGGAVSFITQAGSMLRARIDLERELGKRSIGLFGVDEIQFKTEGADNA